MDSEGLLPSSFRDPSGFLFTKGGKLYRQVNQCCSKDYDALMASGLYSELTARGLLVPHEEVDLSLASRKGAHKVIEPTFIQFSSYPYEWCFSELKDAALATLEIQKAAIKRNMTLKDASAYNIQFRGTTPVFIDTLSFTEYGEGEPWIAYRQFCQHFLAPLALMARTDERLASLFRLYVDGIPLDLASKLLPSRTRLSFGLLTHIHLHALSQRHYAQASPQKLTKPRHMNRNSMLALLDSLTSVVKGLKWRPAGTEWADYYDDTNYTKQSLDLKQQLVAGFVERIKPRTVWDLGANIGMFSRIAVGGGALAIAFDVDPAAVERNYLACREKKETRILPLVMDLTNPSASLGWGHGERMSMLERGPADMMFALALVHHLAISNNVPFAMIADFFARACGCLVIEFVPKQDSQVQRLLVTREDIFTEYDRAHFEEAFSKRFTIDESADIEGTQRTLYLMKRRG